jgi:hypothetical protein
MLISRRGLRRCAWLAFSALAIQLVAAFGHIHKEDWLPAAPAQTAASGSAHSSGGGTPPPAQPAGHDDHDALCSICASIALAGALLLPAPPVITFAPTYHAVRLHQPAFVVASSEQRAYFQARGPPA